MNVVHRLVDHVWTRIALAIALGLSGFPFGLYEKLAYIDESIHFAASFVLAPVVAAFVAPESFARVRRPRLVLLVVTCWLGAMAVWEFAEYSAVEFLGMDLLIGYTDTMSDFVFDTAAATLAVFFARRDDAPRGVDPDGDADPDDE